MFIEELIKRCSDCIFAEKCSYFIYLILGGAFEGVEDQVSPFGYKRGEGIDAGAGEPEWIVNKERYKYDSMFESLGPQDGKITGAGKANKFLQNLYSS